MKLKIFSSYELRENSDILHPKKKAKHKDETIAETKRKVYLFNQKIKNNDYRKSIIRKISS